MNDDITHKNGLTENKESSANGATKETAQEQKKPNERIDEKTKEERNDKYYNYKTSRELFEECLKASFSEIGKQELISIISNKFSELGRKISHQHDIDTLILNFIDYCASHGKFNIAWEVIKEKRSTWYNDFFPRWNLAVQREKNIEVGYKHRQQEQIGKEDIVDWFFKLDDPVTQSMVITAALFQGVERSTFNELKQNIHDLLFPAVQGPPRSEPSSDESKDDSEQQQQPLPLRPRLKNELEQFHAAKLKFVSDKRNSDYGLADVEIVIFEFKDNQTKLLKLIKDSLFSKKAALFSFVEELGHDENAEKRLFAVNAVIALSETHLFQDLLDHIIRKWAKTEDYYTHQATASALSGILLQERQNNEILALLNSWLKNGTSIFLNITSMFTYYLIADKYPDQALHAIEHVSSKENSILSLKSLDIAFRVYRSNRSKFIAHLYNWIKDDRPLLRQQAGIYFFRFIDLDDAVEDQDTRAKIVEIISTLWKGRNMPLRLKMQQATAEKVRAWAEESLTALERDENEIFLRYQTLFYELYRTCKDKLDYYFNKWQEYRDYRHKHALERGASSESLYPARKINFSIFIPDER